MSFDASPPTDPRHITGQVFIRESGPVTLDGRRLVQFVGVIALDERALKDEHQYAVLGRVEADSGIVRLSIMPHTGAQDRAALAEGKTLDAILREPIWIT